MFFSIPVSTKVANITMNRPAGQRLCVFFYYGIEYVILKSLPVYISTNR